MYLLKKQRRLLGRVVALDIGLGLMDHFLRLSESEAFLLGLVPV